MVWWGLDDRRDPLLCFAGQQFFVELTTLERAQSMYEALVKILIKRAQVMNESSKKQAGYAAAAEAKEAARHAAAVENIKRIEDENWERRKADQKLQADRSDEAHRAWKQEYDEGQAEIHAQKEAKRAEAREAAAAVQAAKEARTAAANAKMNIGYERMAKEQEAREARKAEYLANVAAGKPTLPKFATAQSSAPRAHNVLTPQALRRASNPAPKTPQTMRTRTIPSRHVYATCRG